MTTDLLAAAARGDRLDDDAIRHLATTADTAGLTAAARARRDLAHGALVTYSPKVFIPLIKLCRDTCRYCTFAETPRPGANAYLTADEVLAIARAGAAAGCREALFTLGDKPEARWDEARAELDRLGYPSTIAYLAAMAKLVLDETGLLPHANPGVMDDADVALLRGVSVSQGMMVEVLSERLCEKGGPHHGCPDKRPAVRLATLEAAGRARVPFTTGILMGIGETLEERTDSLLAIRVSHERHGHVQEVIVQNFRAKPGTRMAEAPDAPHEEHLRAIALARLALPPEVTVQAPPNLSPGHLEALVDAGIDDWGGVSPVTIDHVNPEAPWPHLAELEARTRAAGRELAPRLPVHPRYVHAMAEWIDPALHRAVRAQADTAGLARGAWSPGQDTIAPPPMPAPALASTGLSALLTKARDGKPLAEGEIVRLFAAQGREFAAVAAAADALRRDVVAETVSYVVCRNINYTNICTYKCRFCAFSKGKTAEALRGRPYDLPHEEIAARTVEAWERGGTEVCMQGGIHPDYTGQTYLDILATVKGAVPQMHVHAFSPLEVWQGAATLGASLEEFLAALKRAGLGSLPGTAAEILDDEVRAVLCPDKLNTAQWLEVMRTAHGVGLRSTATVMYGHVERPEHWARHLIRIRDLQRETGGFTEFVPLPFVHMEAPIYLKGGARKGPTWREAVLMHAVGRLALHPWVPNIQTSWVKMGPEGVTACLNAGANDLGGTLMDESITRAAGAAHGQEMPPAEMDALARAAGRPARQRTTTYGQPPAGQVARSYGAAPLRPTRNPPPARARQAAEAAE
ncbi:5-amino-6-(D-ribitylamino)uracil--L-tyrosine 4-hydroxyphenyl transferase CofH [Azospirillum sp.]|uniref:5-amino-6-(D-ribitylamino)uracil--L-tyrosine 4-hydroxyphenyl transferase CofH n=1 Tax=Azospirillum sp. TaxID=34012 RepID=UPI003D73DE4D